MSYLIKERSWRMDRRVPLALLLTLVLHFAAVLVWATKLDARLQFVEKHAEHLASNSDRLARIEERLDVLRRDSEQIQHKLDVLTQRLIRE